MMLSDLLLSWEAGTAVAPDSVAIEAVLDMSLAVTTLPVLIDPVPAGDVPGLAVSTSRV